MGRVSEAYARHLNGRFVVYLPVALQPHIDAFRETTRGGRRAPRNHIVEALVWKALADQP